MKAMRKSILACVLCLALCLGLFAGATFAWFTDTVSSTGNTITAGTLDVEAYAYDLAGDADRGMSVTIDGVNGGEAITFSSARQDLNKNDPPPIINESNWEPGQSSAKLLQVQNTGTLNAKISLEFVASGKLEGALWFDFINVTADGEVTGAFTQRPMSTLETFAQGMEFPLAAANDTDSDTLYFVFVYGMDTAAGNEYQNTSFTASVNVLATQATGEEDGFGNPDYDADADLPVGGLVNIEAEIDGYDAVYVTPENYALTSADENYESDYPFYGGMKSNTVYYFAAGEYNALGLWTHAAENVAFVAQGEVTVNGSFSVGYHTNHDKNAADKTDSLLLVAGFTVNGTMNINGADQRVIVYGNTVNEQLTINTYRIENAEYIVENNTVDGTTPGTQQYGIYFVPEATDYCLYLRNNTIRNIGSHAFVIQGVGQGSAVTAAAKVDLQGNTFESWGTGGKENRGAVKIWGDTKIAPESMSSEDELSDDAKQLVRAVLAGRNQFNSDADNTVIFEFYDYAFDALSNG